MLENSVFGYLDQKNPHFIWPITFFSGNKIFVANFFIQNYPIRMRVNFLKWMKKIENIPQLHLRWLLPHQKR